MTTEVWRGVAAEEAEEITQQVSLLLRARTRRLLGELLRPNKRRAWLAVASIVTGTTASLAIPYLVGVGIDDGIPALRRHDAAPVLAVIVAIVACSLVQAVLYRAFVRLTGQVGQGLLLELRQRAFAHLQSLSLSFHERYTSGRVISRLTSDIESISAMFEQGLDQLVIGVLSIVGVGIWLLLLDWPLGLIALVTFGPLLWMSRWYQRESSAAYRRTRESIARVIVHFTESLRGIRAVQAFRRETRNEELFGELNDDYRRTMVRSFRLLTIYWPGIRLTGDVVTAVILLVGSLFVIDGRLEVGVLASFFLYLRRFFEPMADVSQFYDSFQSAASGLEKLAGVLDESPAVAMPAVSRALPPGGWRGHVGFDGVSFAYRPGTREILHDFSLEVPAGQTVALLGQTGAGKSTLARLLSRFYDPTSGVIRVDGVDLRDLAEPDLREAVAMVTQESFLFGGTVADNIAFGRPTATRAEVEAAGDAVGVRSVVDRLGGYDAEVGKNGARLSAGQRQLVALARAFLADPAVLILDEASSSLDAPTERLVQDALRRVLAGRTAVIIAHRLSTVAIADRVLVLDHGQVVEDGTPDELLAAGDGEYAALHRQWQDSLV